MKTEEDANIKQHKEDKIVVYCVFVGLDKMPQSLNSLVRLQRPAKKGHNPSLASHHQTLSTVFNQSGSTSSNYSTYLNFEDILLELTELELNLIFVLIKHKILTATSGSYLVGKRGSYSSAPCCKDRKIRDKRYTLNLF